MHATSTISLTDMGVGDSSSVSGTGTVLMVLSGWKKFVHNCSEPAWNCNIYGLPRSSIAFHYHFIGFHHTSLFTDEIRSANAFFLATLITWASAALASFHLLRNSMPFSSPTLFLFLWYDLLFFRHSLRRDPISLFHHGTALPFGLSSVF